MKQSVWGFAFWTKKIITSTDLYPKVVNFTWDGKDQFQTFFGGIVSMIIRIFTFAIAVSLQWCAKNDPYAKINEPN